MTKFDKAFCKVQSMTADTNVISDLFALSYFAAKAKEQYLDEEEKSYHARCLDSKKALYLMVDFDVEKIGVPMVYRELRESPPMHNVYKRLFEQDARIGRECKGLAEKYVSKAGLKPADALIAAIASANQIDVLLSWNRSHLTNPTHKKEIEEINDAHGTPTPAILTPREFLDRFVKTANKKTFGLNPSPVLPVYRVDFYLSKCGL